MREPESEPDDKVVHPVPVQIVAANPFDGIDRVSSGVGFPDACVDIRVRIRWSCPFSTCVGRNFCRDASVSVSRQEWDRKHFPGNLPTVMSRAATVGRRASQGPTRVTLMQP